MILFTNIPLLLVFISYAVCLLTTADGVKWPSADQEALDELHDYEMLKAVQQSMLEWRTKSHYKHNRRKRQAADVAKVCYGQLGCFEDSGPFGYLDMLPASPEDINTKFVFYSTKNRGDRALLEFSYFNISSALGIENPDPFYPYEGYSTTEEVISSTLEPTTTNPGLPMTTTSQNPLINTSKSSGTINKLRKRSSMEKNKIKDQMDQLEGLDSLSIRVIVHGFGSSCPHVWIYELRTALMAVEDCIVICVDWERGAALPNYVKAAANTRLVGKQLAMLLMALQNHKNVQMDRVHIIGFSLGAHVAGFAGAETPGLRRITGLDPAGPLFESQHPKARLDSTDADFVDVIHSNGENLILGGLGSWQPMGHVDFYPNGGRVQHGCSNLFVGAVTDFIWTPTATIEGRSLCNHRRAYKFFINSVAPRCLFPAFPCSSYEEFLHGNCYLCDKHNATSQCGNMGYYADRSTGRGQLFLVTREEEPFCAHQYNIEIYSAVSDLPLRTMGKFEASLIGEGGLNETFTVTDKDDAELFAGEKIAKVVVPHPALGFPTSIQLTYKSYNGWLSRGIQFWNVYKVVLTDSFGKSYSICKRFFALESGVPQRLDLLPGNCHIPEEVYELDKLPLINLERVDEDRHSNQDFSSFEASGSEFKKTNYGLNEEEQENGPWQNLIEGNGLDRESTESSRSFHNEDNDEIFEPVLKTKNGKISRGRNLDGFSNEEIVEPVLKATTQRLSRDNPRPIPQQNERKGRENSFLSVQLFPFRLGELLERAERYARMTLLPLISETAPRLFGFGTVVSDENPETDRKAKQLIETSITHEQIEQESTSPKNIYESLRESANKTKIVQSRSIQDLKYYSNINDLTASEDAEGIDRSDVELAGRTGHFLDFDPVKIELPTYKPPAKTFKEFPYEFVSPESVDEFNPDSTTTEAVPEPKTRQSYRSIDQGKPKTSRFIPLLFGFK